MNNELKKELYESGKYKNFKERKKDNFKCGCVVNDYTNYVDVLTEQEFNSCFKMYDARKHQASRLEHHISYLFQINRTQNHLVFATFTFNDNFDGLDEKTKRKYLQRILNCGYVLDYIFNKDYGTDKGRFHYHAIILIAPTYHGIKTSEHFGQVEIPFLKDSWVYGYCSFKPINTLEHDDDAKISKYMSKLTFHAIKVKQDKISVKRDSFYQKMKKEQKRLHLLSNAHKGLTEQDYLNYVETPTNNPIFNKKLEESMPF